MGKLDTLEQLNAAFAAAPFVANGWHHAVDMLGRAEGGWCGQLLGVSPAGSVHLNMLTRLSTEDIVAFERAGGAIEALNPRAKILRSPVGSIYSDADLVDPSEKGRSAIFQELFEPYNAHDVVMTNLGAFGEAHIALVMIYARGQADKVEAGRSLLSRVAGAANAALETQLLVDRSLDAATISTLDAIEAVAFLLDRSGKLIDFSASAILEIERGDFIIVARDRLVLRDARAAGAFEVALTRSLNTPPSSSRGRLSVLARDVHDRVRRIDVARLPEGGTKFPRRAQALVVIGPPPPLRDALTALRQVYGLSPAEAHIALELARGASSNEIAARRGVALGTARDQIKAVLSQTNTRKASALAAMLTQLGVSAADADD